ncbi:MAG: hypothetical protein GXO69_11440 [Acidobacteria bacterium]|nr:hypothetical protein [Acidobacteriota bacterium]
MRFKLILTIALLFGAAVPSVLAGTAGNYREPADSFRQPVEPVKTLTRFLPVLKREKGKEKTGNQALYVGSEYCIACHPTKSGWRGTRHALDVREPRTEYSLVSGKGVVADYDRNGIDDFVQGLDFNLISSAFDNLKPYAPVLSADNGKYFISIGELKMEVTATIGGTGKWGQLYVVRVPVSDKAGKYSMGNYVSPVKYNEKTGQYELYHKEAWYDDENRPKFNSTTTTTILAADNSSSFARNCSQCHSMASRGLQQDESGEWIFTPFIATLYSPDDPSYTDIDYNGFKDLLNTGCEGCHGPGSAHILGGGDISRIINPADLDPEQMISDCSTCHISNTFSDTNHPLLNSIAAASKHNDTQNDVADELGEERAGQTPDEVVNVAMIRRTVSHATAPPQYWQTAV